MPAPRKYPAELRERAVRLWRDSDPRPSIAQVARKLGVHPEALRNWIRQDEANKGERSDRPSTAELEVIRQLKRENAELKRANEILKLASSYFALRLPKISSVQVMRHVRTRGGCRRGDRVFVC